MRGARTVRHRIAIACGVVLAGLAACDDFDPPHPKAASTADAATARDAAASDAGVEGPSADASADAALDAAPPADAAPPPRNPLAFARAGSRYVFVANPRERSVAIIDASSQRIQHAGCGFAPQLVAASARDDIAIALDSEGKRACVLRVGSERVTTAEVAVVEHANSVVFAPDAPFAIAYHDQRLDAAGARVLAQAVSVIALGDEVKAANVAAGLSPREVIFADANRVLVTSDGGISSIPLEAAARGEHASAPARSFDLATRLTAKNIRVDRRASRALAFETEGDVLHVIDLASDGSARKIALGPWGLTDADADDAGVIDRLRIADAQIEAGGSHAWIALRGEQTLLRVSLTSDAAEIERVSLLGQPTDRLTLLGSEPEQLFVTALAAADGRSTLIRLDDERRTVRLLLAAAGDELVVAERGEVAAVVQRKAAEGFTGYSLVDARDGSATLRQTESSPDLFELSSAAHASVFAFPKSAHDAAALYLTRFESAATREIELAADPLAVGFCSGAERAFVQLAHPDGRLLLVDVAQEGTRSVTGFLIPSRGQE